MKIKHKNIKQFGELKPGDVFHDAEGHVICIKVSGNESFNAVALDVGVPMWYSANDGVFRVNGAFVIS